MGRQARAHCQLWRARGRQGGGAVEAGAAGGEDAGGGDDARAGVSGEGGHGEGESGGGCFVRGGDLGGGEGGGVEGVGGVDGVGGGDVGCWYFRGGGGVGEEGAEIDESVYSVGKSCIHVDYREVRDFDSARAFWLE